MAVTILSKVIDEGFIKALTKVGSSSSSDSTGQTTLRAKQEVSLSEGFVTELAASEPVFNF